MTFGYAIISIISIGYSIFKLTGNGISAKVRKMILFRHCAGILLFFLCNFYEFLKTFLFLLEDSTKVIRKFDDNTFVKILKFLFLSQGIYFFAARLTERAFLNTIKKKCNCRKKPENY